MSDAAIPQFIADRRWWTVPLLVWASVVGLSFYQHCESIEEQSVEVATVGARNLFRMVVLTRAWNAQHGGIYVPVTAKLKPNPYLDHPQRDIVTTEGRKLTMVNPAYMTRLLGELAEAQGVSAFHITSLKPIRPENAADDWERTALTEFEHGLQEKVEVIEAQPGYPARLRYMAPLKVIQACMICHEKQGYKVGDIRGGISVTQPLADIRASAASARQNSIQSHLATFVLVALFGGLLLEMLRSRWVALGNSNAALREANQAAEAANIAKDAFLASMSHELRTPLNAIVGYAHLLRRRINDPNQRAQLDGIHVAATRLLSMFSLMFDMVKAENGELQIANEPFELVGLAEKLHANMARDAATKGLACGLEVFPDRHPCLVFGDPLRISQLLEQYIENAIKFSDRGQLTLRLTRTPRPNHRIDLLFEVEDQGIGIDTQSQQQLFHLFKPLDDSRTRRHGGNGAGLYMCRQLAERMGGKIGFTSTPGEGSRFWFSITLDTTADDESSPLSLPTFGSHAARTPVGYVENLACLLANDDFAAVALWRENAAQLRRTFGKEAPGIEAAINEFRFRAALEAIEQFQQHRAQPGSAVDGEKP